MIRRLSYSRALQSRPAGRDARNEEEREAGAARHRAGDCRAASGRRQDARPERHQIVRGRRWRQVAESPAREGSLLSPASLILSLIAVPASQDSTPLYERVYDAFRGIVPDTTQ